MVASTGGEHAMPALGAAKKIAIRHFAVGEKYLAPM